jgi:hypothetical protein
MTHAMKYKEAECGRNIAVTRSENYLPLLLEKFTSKNEPKKPAIQRLARL